MFGSTGLIKLVRAPLVASAMLSLSVALATATPAAACDPGRPNWVGSAFAGTKKAAAPIRIRADIEQYVPFVPPNNQGDANVQAWVMMDQGNSHWVQMGWMQTTHDNGSHERRHWEQHTYQSGAYFNNFFGTAPSTGTTRYAIWREYDSGQGSWEYTFKLNSVDTGLSLHLGTWEPDQSQWFGEINAYGSQMPGDTVNKVKFDTVEWAGGDLVWHAANTAAVVSAQGDGGLFDTDNWESDKRTADSYKIWDTKCP